MNNLTIDKEFHALIPPLRPEELSLLESSIKERGCLDAIKIWSGIIVDGHNRFAICTANDIEFRTEEMEFNDRTAAKYWIEDNQLGRRNLTPEQFTYFLGRRYNRMKKIKGGTGANQYKVQMDQNEPSATTADKLAKEYKVSPATVRRAGKVAEEVEKSPDLQMKIFEGKPIKEIRKEISKKERDAARATMAKKGESVHPDKRWSVQICDIADFKPTTAFDYIITDPPYPKEYLPLYKTLAERAGEWLSDGGLLVAMCGQSYIDQIYSMMTEHLDYYWTACYLTPGQATALRTRNVNTNWKPLLMFTKKGDTYKGKIFGDVFKSDGNDKSMHKWGQSESGMLSIISGICLPGQTILDPFLGAGTTGVAALKHGCLFSGCDIDEECVNISKSRMSETQNDLANL